MEKLIEGLNEDLANEYAASIMYTNNAAVVSGLYRHALKTLIANHLFKF